MLIKRPYFNCFCLFMAAAFFLNACSSDTATDTPAAEAAPRPAKLLTIRSATRNNFLNYPAVIKAQQLSTLTFEVSGMLTELMVVESQMVKKGDVLAKLDQRNLKAKLASVKAQYDNANAEYKRAVSLMKEDAIARNVLEQRKSQWNVSKAQLDTAKKALADAVLIAPYPGAIAKVSLKKRQMVQAGKPAISILGNAGLEAVVHIPASIVAKAGNQEPATDSYVVLNAAPERKIPIVVKEVSLEADAASQTYQVIFSFDSPKDFNILPGMNGSVWFRDPGKVYSSSSKISIPMTAVVIAGDQKYVWVVDDKTMAVSKRSIVVEVGVGATIGVVSGLSLGDTIVAAGASSLSEGSKVVRWSK